MVVGLVGAVLCGALLSFDPAPQVRERIERGRELFGVHCASCHGKDAFGHGPLAVDLRRQVPDLSRITERHGGEFPAAEVRESIDGTQEVPGHGARGMPVWGEGFGRGVRATSPEEVARALDALVAFIEDIQGKGPPPGG